MGSVADVLGGGGVKSFFDTEVDKPGHTTGWVAVVEAGVDQSTTMDEEKALVFWDPPQNTKPKLFIWVKVQAFDETDDDSGVRKFNASGQRFTALQQATRSNGYEINPGDGIKITYRGKSENKPKVAGHRRAELYDIEFAAGKFAKNATAEALKPAKKSTKSEALERPDSVSESDWASLPDPAKKVLLASLGSGPA